jgi:hypothetical protein
LTIVGGLAMAFTIWVGLVVFQVVGLFANPTLPVSEGARLVEIRSIDVAAKVQEERVLHDFLDWQQSLRSVTDVGGWRDSSAEPPMRMATIAVVDPSYFEVLDARVLAGRAFTNADVVPGTGVAIVDQGFVDQILQGRNAVGQQVRFPGPPGKPGDPARPSDWYEVIGVVADLGVGSATRPGRAAGFYLPGTPDLFDEIHMLVHVRGGDPMALAPQVREVATAVDPSLRLVDMQRANEANNDVLWVMTLWLRITVVLSAVAIVLSLAGIYAVLSFTVARRTREIGVRVALGASRQRVVVATFRRPLLQVTAGIVIGTAIVFIAATLLQNTELPGSESELTLQGIAMIIGYGIVMLGVCLLGCVVPTRRALNIEPTIALRTE